MAEQPPNERPTIESKPTVALDPPKRKLGPILLRVGGIGLGLLVVGVIAGIVLWNSAFVQNEFQRPLGPTLIPVDQNTGPDRPAGTPSLSETEGDGGQLAVGPTPDTVCDGPQQLMILAVGSDNEEGYVRGLADVIRVVRVDFVTPEVHVLTVPRDLWVQIPNLGPYAENLRGYLGVGIDPETGELVEGDYGKINTAYFYGNLYDLPGEGPGTLALTINQNLGIPVERYLAVNMQILADLVDEVGGITVEVPYDVSGFSAGTYHMDGETALAYSRVRRDDSDFFRSTRQTIVLLALREEYSKPQNYRRIPQITDRFLDETLTDLSRRDITALSCLATRIDRDSITSHAINDNHVTFGTTTRRSSILWPNEKAIQQVIDEFMGNTE